MEFLPRSDGPNLVPGVRSVAVLNKPVTVPERQELVAFLAGFEQPRGLEIKLYEARGATGFKAARAPGITMPRALLLSADEVML